jgi:formylglycine-generating enzyme required for sulfatase activity/DNA-binding winged helix-turn-helix (wHTH) protein
MIMFVGALNGFVHRVLWFDSFALDLTRGCLRTGDQDIDLRPKAFEVLCYLAENAGRLVPKQELYEAVWPNVIVTDDSLVQCIRELRQKLGDDNRRLIKTMSRRGYLLDVTVRAQAPLSLSDRLAVGSSEGPQKNLTTLDEPHGTRPTIVARKPLVWWAIAAALMSVALGVVYLVNRPVSVANVGRLSLTEKTPASLQSLRNFKDCEDCPEMIALPVGEFMMGSPDSEFERREPEGRPRRVVIAGRFAIGRFEITVDQFSAFIADTGTIVGNQCRKIVGFSGTSARWGSPEASFRQPGFEVTGKHPVVCMSWHDAQAYVAWLRRRTGKAYRLPTEAEWEYAGRAGTRTGYSFGDDPSELCAYAKFADLGSRFGWRGGCRSDMATYGTVPVGSLKPNPWGLFDVHGNAWEWVEDCWTPNALEIPTDGSAFSHAGCEIGVIRGGSWAAGFGRVRSATRWPTPTAERYHHVGFRVALSL